MSDIPLKTFLEKYPAYTRTRTYELLNQKVLRGRKFGKKLLVNTESAEEHLASLPEYKAQTGGAK